MGIGKVDAYWGDVLLIAIFRYDIYFTVLCADHLRSLGFCHDVGEYAIVLRAAADGARRLCLCRDTDVMGG